MLDTKLSCNGRIKSALDATFASKDYILSLETASVNKIKENILAYSIRRIITYANL